MGFKSSRYDCDVWMISYPNGHGYDYICTHVDDFKIVSDDPEIYLNEILKVLFVKSHGPWVYYLGNNFTYHDEHGIWEYSWKPYENEAIRKAEEMFGILPRKKTHLPYSECHPELDTSKLLDLK